MKVVQQKIVIDVKEKIQSRLSLLLRHTMVLVENAVFRSPTKMESWRSKEF